MAGVKLEKELKALAEWKTKVCDVRHITNWTLQKFIYLSPEKYRSITDTAAITVGEHWGEPGETGIFKSRLSCGQASDKCRVYVEIITGGEAQLAINDSLYAGNDPNHFRIDISAPYRNNSFLDLQVESYVRFSVNEVGVKTTEIGETGDFVKADVIIVDSEIEELGKDLAFLADLGACDELYLPIVEELMAEIMDSIDFAPHNLTTEKAKNFRKKIDEVISDLPVLDNKHGVYMIGQSHLDIAWFWTKYETYRKTGRTFSSVLRLQEKYPFYTFSMPQIKLFEMLEEWDNPTFEAVKAAVHNGKIEPFGGLYLEPDTNLPCGESLARQFLRGKRYINDQFGEVTAGESLIDAFGYSGNLPQILRQCGIRHVYLTKMRWYNDTTEFPYSVFLWKGVDGTEIPVSTMPWFNRACTPDEVCKNVKLNLQKDVLNDVPVFFGWGDGGGGADDDHLSGLERLLKWQKPYRVDAGTTNRYYREHVQDLKNLPVYEGEIYQEGHRGCFTSQAETKKQNRELEIQLRTLELLDCCMAGYHAKRSKLNREFIEDTLLLNQFHDILPGSSAGAVYQHVRRDYAEAFAEVECQKKNILESLPQDENYVTIFNPTGQKYNAVITVEEGTALADSSGELYPLDAGFNEAVVPLTPYGLCSFRIRQRNKMADDVRHKNSFCLENEKLRAVFTKDGGLQLFDKLQQLAITKNGGMSLKIYEDYPKKCDAWDVDLDYMDKFTVLKPTEIEGAYHSPLREFIRLKYVTGNSQIQLEISLYAHEDFLRFQYTVDWQERHRFLRQEFETNMVQTEAYFDIPFGVIRRDTAENTPYQIAQFEVPAVTFADLCEGNRGLAIISAEKNGYRAKHGNLSVSLLRGPEYPDPEADIGTHNFSIVLYPHSGHYSNSRVVETASMVVNKPVMLNGYCCDRQWISIDNTSAVQLETIKLAENKKGYILRLNEKKGSTQVVKIKLSIEKYAVYSCNLLEELQEEIPARGQTFSAVFSPCQIRSFFICDESLKLPL